MSGPRYSIGELAEITGVSRRTVHFYVQRRLIDPPLGLGRGRHYDDRHVRQIRHVRELQRLGVPLAEMGEMPEEALSVPATPAAAPAPPGAARPTHDGDVPTARSVVRLQVNENVTVELSPQAGPMTPALAADLAAAIGAVLREHRVTGEEEQR